MIVRIPTRVIPEGRAVVFASHAAPVPGLLALLAAARPNLLCVRWHDSGIFLAAAEEIAGQVAGLRTFIQQGGVAAVPELWEARKSKSASG